MGLELIYGGGKQIQLYRTKGDYSGLVKSDGTTAINSTTYTAADAWLTLGGSTSPIISTDVAYDTSGIPTITIVAKTMGTDLDTFIDGIAPRKAGGSAGVTFETGFDQEGNAWGSTSGSSAIPITLIVYSSKTSLNKRKVDAFVCNFDQSSAGFKYEGGKAVECQLKFKGVACGATTSLPIPVGAFSTAMVTSPTAMSIVKDYYKATTTEMTAAA